MKLPSFHSERGGVCIYYLRREDSNIHFPFFVNATPLSLEALDCFMLTKPYPFQTARTPGANSYIPEPQILKACLDLNQGDAIQGNPNSSK